MKLRIELSFFRPTMNRVKRSEEIISDARKCNSQLLPLCPVLINSFPLVPKRSYSVAARIKPSVWLVTFSLSWRSTASSCEHACCCSVCRPVTSSLDTDDYSNDEVTWHVSWGSNCRYVTLVLISWAVHCHATLFLLWSIDSASKIVSLLCMLCHGRQCWNGMREFLQY